MLMTVSDPWARDFYCPRRNCLPCSTRAYLIQEAEETKKCDVRESEKVKEGRKTIPGCMKESINYIECSTCRSEGRTRVYRRETSRSAYQWGVEYQDEVEKGVLPHPMVQHF